MQDQQQRNLTALEAFSIRRPEGPRKRLRAELAEHWQFSAWAAQAITDRVLDPDSLRRRLAAERQQLTVERPSGRAHTPLYRLGVYHSLWTTVMTPLILPLPLPLRFTPLLTPPLWATENEPWGNRVDADGAELHFRFSSPAALIGALETARGRYLTDWKPLRKEINRYGLMNGVDDIRLAVFQIEFADGAPPAQTLCTLNGTARPHLVHELLGLSPALLVEMACDRRQAAARLGRLRAAAIAEQGELDRDGLRRQKHLYSHVGELIVGLSPGQTGLLAVAREVELMAHTDWQARSDQALAEEDD